MNSKLTLFGFFISLFLINSVLALPCAFFGKVTLDGSPTSGTDVEAYYLNGTFIVKGKEPSGLGSYSIAVNAPGENITLKVKGISADQGSKLCKNGESNYLNISATTPPTTTMPSQTETTTTPSGNGGGGGSGRTITTTVPVTTTIVTTEGGDTSMEGENVNIETTVPSQVETTTTPSNTVGITGSFLEIIYSLGYWWILIIIIIVLLVVIILRKYYTIEFKETV